MLFKFKQKPIVLECFTDRADVYNASPIDMGSNNMPTWWKALPKGEFDFDSMRKSTTMKSCAGFIDYYKNCAVLPMWSDLAIKLGPIGTDYYYWQYSDNTSSAVVHPSSQYGNFIDSNFQHLKLESPWIFRTKENVSWLYSENTWGTIQHSTLSILPGSINFKYQSGTDINLIIKKTDHEQRIIIPHNLPFVVIHPMFDRRFKLSLHLVDTQELSRISQTNAQITFGRSYFNMKSARGECPFHTK